MWKKCYKRFSKQDKIRSDQISFIHIDKRDDQPKSIYNSEHSKQSNGHKFTEQLYVGPISLIHTHAFSTNASTWKLNKTIQRSKNKRLLSQIKMKPWQIERVTTGPQSFETWRNLIQANGASSGYKMLLCVAKQRRNNIMQPSLLAFIINSTSAHRHFGLSAVQWTARGCGTARTQ